MSLATFQVDENGDLFLVDGANLGLVYDVDAVTQDIGQATKMLLGENPYDTSQGVDYFGTVFSPQPDYDAFRVQLAREALTIPDTTGVMGVELTKDGNELTYVMEVATVYGTVTVANSIAT